jgi:hypothetical protein
VTLDAADILDLDTTVVEIVPALGGRNYVVPVQMVFHYRAGLVPFDAEVRLDSGWGTTPAENALKEWDELEDSGANMFLESTDQYVFATHNGAAFYAWSADEIEDKAFTVSAVAVPTVGDGSLTVRIIYLVIDGAPA